MNYSSFVAQKLTRQPPTGLDSVPPLHPTLFPHQRDLVAWALRRGRAALFADTGLGKTLCEVEYARHVAFHTDKPVLILAPLAVAKQTSREAKRLGVNVTVCRDAADVTGQVVVTNYERLHRFDPSVFGGVVLDESSIIKHHDAKTLRTLLDAFAATPFKLCATATPSPNDYTELGTHAEFLGVCTRTEMLSEFFCHDGGETQTWRLKGHARQAYWRWVASWAALLRKPSDLGHDDTGYNLPKLTVRQHVLAADPETVKASGLLFAAEASTLSERRDARRGSMAARVRECVDVVNADRKQWVVWCELNAEQDALAKAFGDECVSVYGSLDPDDKVTRYERWAAGEARVLVSKASIFGFGVNMQHASRMAFVGVSDSYEAYYQAIRRCWRFGQKKAVEVHVFASEIEGAVLDNLRRKEADAARMAEELSAETREAVRAEVLGASRTGDDYRPDVEMTVPEWLKSEGEAA